MSSLKPLAMTYTEDDLRLVSPSKSLSAASGEPVADSEPLANISRKSLPLDSPKNEVIVRKPTTSERRRQVNEILAEEEQLDRERRWQDLQRKKEADLREELKRLEMQRKSLTSKAYKPLTPESPPKSRDSKRFSDTRYYDWTRADFLDKSEEHDCELCRLGKEHDRRERERRQRSQNRQAKTDYCKFVDNFVNQHRDLDNF